MVSYNMLRGGHIGVIKEDIYIYIHTESVGFRVEV